MKSPEIITSFESKLSSLKVRLDEVLKGENVFPTLINDLILHIEDNLSSQEELKKFQDNPKVFVVKILFKIDIEESIINELISMFFNFQSYKDAFEQDLLDNGWVWIGEGCNKTVYEKNGEVIKFVRSFSEFADFTLFDSEKDNCFPNKIEELLQPIYFSEFGWIQIQEKVYCEEYNIKKRFGIVCNEFKNWLNNLADKYPRMDIHIGNVGITENGNYVVIDC